MAREKTRYSGTGYTGLAMGIVFRAVEDYRAALSRLTKGKDKVSAECEIQRIRGFFRSEWYEMLCSIPGEDLIKKIEPEFCKKHKCKLNLENLH